MLNVRWIGPSLLVAALALAGCGGDDSGGGDADDDSWAGAVMGDGEVEVGQWSGPASALRVACSDASEDSVEVEITAPGGFVATSTQPVGGGPASLTIAGPDLEVTWDEQGVASTVPEQEPDPEDAVQWGASPTLTSGESSLDEYPLDVSRDYYRFDLNDVTVDCSHG